MDEVDALRLRFASEESEPVNLEDSHYSRLRAELEGDALNLEAESWSLMMDSADLKSLSKEAINRQEVIYELIQTEMHHLRTLKLLLHVFLYELRLSQLLDQSRLEWLFRGVEPLLSLHQHFLNHLKFRQNQNQDLNQNQNLSMHQDYDRNQDHNQKEEIPNLNYVERIGDVIVSQFSGVLREQMVESYGTFCSHHSEAVAFYKEALQSNRKLQSLSRKLGQLPLVRRRGVPECFLLVTQRITKYPILVERILQNTEAESEEFRSLADGLALIRDTITQVDTRVNDLQKASRLRDICQRLDSKATGRLKDGSSIRREDLIQRTLLHATTITWKSSGRQKDVLAVLLSDLLLLLQDKDQRLVFAAVDNKPPVVPLQRLLVREVAHDDRALFLICGAARGLPEMYELQTTSREERATWSALLKAAVESQHEEAELRQQVARLQHFQEHLRLRDEQILQSLTEKQQIFAALYQETMGQETFHRGLLLRGDPRDLQQGETLLIGAINEVEILQNLLFNGVRDLNLVMEESPQQGQPISIQQTITKAPIESSTGTSRETVGGNDVPVYRSHTILGSQLQERISHRGVLGLSTDKEQQEQTEEGTDKQTDEGMDKQTEERTDEMTVDRMGAIQTTRVESGHFSEAEVCDRVILLAQRLYSLQALVSQQDSLLELQKSLQGRMRPSEQQKEELQAQRIQAREEQLQVREEQLQIREENCRRGEERLEQEVAELETQRQCYQEDLERLRESTRAVEREKVELGQEKERLKKVLDRTLLPTGHGVYDNPASSIPFSKSFRGGVANKGDPPTRTSFDPLDPPPKVPPRKESISPQPPRAGRPPQLLSTTNQVQLAPTVQQQIPTKLASMSKDRVRKRTSHQRTKSAATIDVNQLVPIRVKEGGSLRGRKPSSPHKNRQSETLTASGSLVQPEKTFPPFSSAPPVPPPFPTEILKKEQEKVVFL